MFFRFAFVIYSAMSSSGMAERERERDVLNYLHNGDNISATFFVCVHLEALIESMARCCMPPCAARQLIMFFFFVGAAFICYNKTRNTFMLRAIILWALGAAARQ